MKYILAFLVLMFGNLSFAGELDGKNFCREVKTDGSFGQPRGVRNHCVSFNENVMTDNANTFFGNLPESVRYVLVANKVLLVRDGKLYSDYVVDEELKTLKNGVGATLTLK